MNITADTAAIQANIIAIKSLVQQIKAVALADIRK
jgi:hypothetical protein